MLNERVFITWTRSGQHTQTWPDLIEQRLLHDAVGILDSLVELFAFEHEKVFARIQNATLHCDRARRIYIVTGDHTHGDAGTLALANCFGYFGPHRIFDADDAQAGQIAHDLRLILPVRLRGDWCLIRL